MTFTTQSVRPLLSERQAATVSKELESILASSSFTGSKRCQDFLRYVVTHAVSGDYDRLVERFLGAEIFGRSLDYETATDSIVRVRANDVRRRLTEYYSKQEAMQEVTIELVSGSYIPEFHWFEDEKSLPALDLPGSLNLERLPDKLRSRPLRWMLVALCFLLVVSVAAAWIYWRTPGRSVAHFWQPLYRNKGAVLICFGDTSTYWVSPQIQKAVDVGGPVGPIKDGDIFKTTDDATTVGNIRGALRIMKLLNTEGIANDIRWPQELQTESLSSGNTIFIGAFNNPWTMSLNRDLHFAFERLPTADGYIWQVRERSTNRTWANSKTYPQSIDRDYAIITRLIFPDQKRVVISIGGLNQFGTEAAGDFITDGAALNEFARTAPKGWEDKNLQIVLEMGVSFRRAVNPTVVASYVW